MSTETMMALNLHGVNDLRYEEVERPVPQADEVLLRVRAVGICGSGHLRQRYPACVLEGNVSFPHDYRP